MLPVAADANVLVSAAISPRGPSAQIVQLAQQGDIALWVCEKLIDEVADVLARDHLQKYISPDEASDYVDAITLLANWVDDRPEIEVPKVCPDPDDNYLIALYQDADAHMLVSGDKGVRSVQYPNVYIYSPADALEAIAYRHEWGDAFVPGDSGEAMRSATAEGSIALINVYAAFRAIVDESESAPDAVELLQFVTVPSAIPYFAPVLPQVRAMLARRGLTNRPWYASPEVAYLKLPPDPGEGLRVTSDAPLPVDTIFATLLRCPDLPDPPGMSFDHWRVFAIGATVRPEDIPPRGV
jgi:putative PIN family toxin of toxin-antitoxin system